MEGNVFIMGMARIIFGALSLGLGGLMIKLNRVETALTLNGVMGVVGPLVFIFVSGVGIAGLADKLPVTKMIALIAGMGLILWGTR